MPHIIAVCPLCSEVRYRSLKPIETSDDARPENFEPQGEAPPHRGDGPPMCHICGSVLKFAPAEALNPAKNNVVRLEARNAVSQANAKASQAEAGLTTLFEPDPGEEIRSVLPARDNMGLVVVTTKRIVRVDL